MVGTVIPSFLISCLMSSNTCLNECPHSHPQQHHQNHTTIIISHSKTIPYYINTHPFSLESSVSLVLCFSLSSLSLTLDYQISGSVPYFSASCVFPLLVLAWIFPIIFSCELASSGFTWKWIGTAAS